LAALANIQRYDSSAYSQSSSQPPSSASSLSSTPALDAIDVGLNARVKSSRLPFLQPNNTQWTEPNVRPATAQSFTSNSSELPQKPSCCCGGDSNGSQGDTKTTLSSTPISDVTSDNGQQFRDWSLFQASLPNDHYIPPLNTDFGSYELEVGCNGMQSPSMPPEIHQEKSCGCGENCACFACATHPNNRTTTDYVRYHQELLVRSQYDLQGGHQFNINFPNQHQNTAFPQQMKPDFSINQHARIQAAMSSPNGANSPHFEDPQHMAPSLPMYSIPQSHVTLDQQFHSFEQQQQYQPNISSLNGGLMNGQRDTHLLQSETSVELGDSEDEASTMSPSSFLLQQFTIGECSDMTGTCLCGEGCQCTGCLTHSGHRNA
jgi:hypothetical protein